VSWVSWLEGQTRAIEQSRRRRVIRDLDARGPVGLLSGGKRVVSFASNDYLGLSFHPQVLAAACDALHRWGAGAGSARLIVGSRPIHSELEAELAAWKDAERALVFASGYAANHGVLGALGGKDALVCSDELNHASIIDGCRLSRAEVAVYHHADVDQLDAILSRSNKRALVVTDAVFSMDGDIAPLADIARVCARRGALLVVDEAHAVLGPEVPDGAHVLRVGTLSKSLGSMGGFVCGPARWIELVVNRARSFVFTTASAPPVAAAALAALRVVRSPEGCALKNRLRSLVDRLAPGHPSPIVPVILGDEQRSLDAATRLLERGLLVPAIRPPTVPPGGSRLRISLSAAHTEEQVDVLCDALRATIYQGADA